MTQEEGKRQWIELLQSFHIKATGIATGLNPGIDRMPQEWYRDMMGMRDASNLLSQKYKYDDSR